MDRKLALNENRLAKFTTEFNSLSTEINNVTFEIWTEIPEFFQQSYYDNETLINPVQETFEQWQAKLKMRPNSLYSVALINNQIVSSVYSGWVINERIINLWATNEEYRKRGIGKAVLLNLIKYLCENHPNEPLNAWDITNHHVDNVLIALGFE